MPTSRPGSRETHTTGAVAAASTALTKVLTTSQHLKVPDRPPKHLPGSVVVRVLFGSNAHGTDNPKSDEDWRGVFQLPNSAFLGLTAPKTTHEEKPDQVYHEIGHYMRLLLKGNPNIVGMLFAPDDCISQSSWVWETLLQHRRRFLTRRMASAYRGWLFGEMMKAEKQDRFPSKRLAHVPRLAYELQSAVEGQDMIVRLTGWRQSFVMDVKEGRAGYDAVKLEVDRVMEEIEPKLDAMPMAPTEFAEELLLRFRGEWAPA